MSLWPRNRNRGWVRRSEFRNMCSHVCGPIALWQLCRHNSLATGKSSPQLIILKPDILNKSIRSISRRVRNVDLKGSDICCETHCVNVLEENVRESLHSPESGEAFKQMTQKAWMSQWGEKSKRAEHHQNINVSLWDTPSGEWRDEPQVGRSCFPNA